MIPFPFNENRFSVFVANHLLVGQLCTNPKSDRSLLSCLKMTQCSKSEFGDAPLLNSHSLPIQVMTTGSLPAPSKLPRITLFTNPTARAGYDTRSIFKRSLTIFNSEFSFSIATNNRDVPG